MPVDTCVFCRIIRKEVPSTVIKETDGVVAIKDIAPKAPIHYLIFPKKHIRDLQSIDKADLPLVNEIAQMAQEISRTLSGSQAFRLVFNNGAQAGQSVFHMHGHFLSGKQMSDL